LFLNTLLYTLLALALDIVLGAAHRLFVCLRSRLAGQKPPWIHRHHAAWRFPASCSRSGTCAFYHRWDFPGAGGPLTSSWFILVIAYTMRRLPYTVSPACYAALQQVPHQLGRIGAQNLGANRLRTFMRITLPMIAGRGGRPVSSPRHFLRGNSLRRIMLVPRIELGPISYASTSTCRVRWGAARERLSGSSQSSWYRWEPT